VPINQIRLYNPTQYVTFTKPSRAKVACATCVVNTFPISVIAKLTVGFTGNDGDSILKLLDLQTHFNCEIVAQSLHPENTHISIQSDFMLQRLMDFNQNTGRSIGGILTDVT
jgi:hypothetical protein